MQGHLSTVTKERLNFHMDSLKRPSNCHTPYQMMTFMIVNAAYTVLGKGHLMIRKEKRRVSKLG